MTLKTGPCAYRKEGKKIQNGGRGEFHRQSDGLESGDDKGDEATRTGGFKGGSGEENNGFQQKNGTA